MSAMSDEFEMVSKYEATIATLRAELAEAREALVENGLHMHDMASRTIAAEAALASVRGDAGRYAWLRDGHGVGNEGRPFIARNHRGAISAWTGPHADAAIDAAIAGEGGNG